MKKFSTDFTQGNIFKQLLSFALPLYAANLLQLSYNIVDMIIVGQAAGTVGLSAISIGGDLTNALMFLASGLSSAGLVIIAQLYGAGRKNELGHFLGNMLTMILCCGLFITIVFLSLRTEILLLMNTPAETFVDAYDYMTITLIGMVFIYGINALNAILRGLGDSRHPLAFIAMSNILNLLLDILFVFFFGLGAKGAALATVTSQGLCFFVCVIFLVNNFKNFDFPMHIKYFLAFDKNLIIKFFKLGIPMAIQNAAIHLSKLFVNSWINSYGMEVSAFVGIAHKINIVQNRLSNAISTAGSAMIAQNIGAKKFKRVKKILRILFIIALSSALILSITVLTFPENIFGIFTNDELVLQIGMIWLPIAVLLFFGNATRVPMNALIQGSGNHVANYIIALMDGIILRVGLALLFGITFNMRYLGFWLGDALAGFAPFIIGSVLYFSGRWKKI